jgi:GAF domain-containing protein
VGYYLHHPEKKELVLNAYVGEPTDHTHIPFGKGICGQVALSNENFIVDDVNAQDNYIACSLDVKSEIVIPLFVNEHNIGQIDIDSNRLRAFSEKDATFLGEVNHLVSVNLF